MCRWLSLIALGICLISVCAAALTAPQVARAQIAGGGYEPPIQHDGKPHYEKSEEKFGSFSVTRNVEDYRSLPLLHGPWLIRESVLAWRDSTGKIAISFVDDGARVEFSAEAASADGMKRCLLRFYAVGYDPGPSSTRNWENLQPFIGEQLRTCEAISRADLQRAMAEMKAAAVDYAAAANAWKTVAVTLFGREGRRCVAYRKAKSDSSLPRFECVRYSKPRLKES